ncbi:hypothetical protein [Hydrogenophaga sp.]|uniref:hypothetical protein n=1 Tax=Hydrogenophaga sp. TaxID=1904254 RepID=UPI002726F0E5|nr:hypothetical protein [Hydrogenophaga sp.]MDO9434243.1 hypothetical protein [Hydrogenophaga sp.]
MRPVNSSSAHIPLSSPDFSPVDSSPINYSKSASDRQEHIEFRLKDGTFKHLYLKGTESIDDLFDIVKGSLGIDAGKNIYIASSLGMLASSQEQADHMWEEGMKSIYAENVKALMAATHSITVSY